MLKEVVGMSEGKFEQLQAVIDEYKDTKGSLMPVMQKAQEIFGAVTFEVQNFIAEKMDIPMTDVYGVATFYSQFALEPKGEHVISVCLGTACYVRGVQAVLDRLVEELDVEVGKTTKDRKFTLEATRCLGCCGLAPVMTIDGNVYAHDARRRHQGRSRNIPWDPGGVTETMEEISLHVLDIVQNSLNAGAALIHIEVDEQEQADTLIVRVADDGSGMPPELVAKVTDPS